MGFPPIGAARCSTPINSVSHEVVRDLKRIARTAGAAADFWEPAALLRQLAAEGKSLQPEHGGRDVTEAVIVSTARTGLGKSWKGAFNMTYGATLGAHAVRHAVARARLDPAEVEDVIMGSTFGEGTTGGNIARAIALRAGLPVTTAGLSINRFCSSGLQSIAIAAQRVMTEGATRIRGRGPGEHLLRPE